MLKPLPVSEVLHYAATFGHFGQLLFRLKQQGSRQHLVAVEESNSPAGTMIGTRRKKDKEAEKDLTKQNQPVLVGFRAAYVFDVSQTEGADPSRPERARQG